MTATPFIRSVAYVSAAVLLAGCTMEPTRKDIPAAGSPDVVVHCSDFDDKAFDPATPSSFTPPEAFRDDTVGQDIARARQHVNRMRRCYRFLGDYAAKKASLLDVPLIGAAIAGTGAILYRANIDVVSGFGLAAGGISTAKLYYHPAANQQTYIAAEKQLTCIYDATHVTRFTLVGDILTNDHLLLENLTEQVTFQAGPLLHSDPAKQTDPEKALIKAVTDATDGARKSLDAIEGALADYRQTPTAIYDTADRIDFAARDSARMTIAYADAINTLQSSINLTLQNKSTVADARASLLKAQASTGDAAGTKPAAKGDPKKAGAITALTAHKEAELPETITSDPHTSCKPNQPNCIKVTTGILKPNDQTPCPAASVKDKAPVLKNTTADQQADKCKSADTEKQSELPADQYRLRAFDPVSDKSTNIIYKLIAVSNAVLDDIPQPAFSEVRTSIAKCVITPN